MQSLPNKSRPHCFSSSSDKNSSFEPIAGWEAASNESHSENEYQKIIQTANNILSLDKVFVNHNVILEKTYSSTGWDYKGRCPFEDHNDSTPSFGYNPRSNFFNCFGCHRSGKAVEFLSYIHNRPKIKVAKEIIYTYGSDTVTVQDICGTNFNEIKIVLFEYADYALNFKKKHKYSEKSLAYIKAANWNLDIFLRKNSDLYNIETSSLKARINKIKEQLELFEEKQ